MTHEAYTEIGGVTKALVNHAEAVYTQLRQVEQKQVQQIFLQLVNLSEGAEDTRRLATCVEAGNWKLITVLANARLVVTGRNEQIKEDTVEVVHEALIRNWQRLRRWIMESYAELTQKHEIELAATKWNNQGKAKDYLLQGRLLKAARAFQNEQSRNVLLTNLTALLFYEKPAKKLMHCQNISGSLALSSLANEFIQKSFRQRQLSRIKLFGFGLVFPLSLLLLVGRELNEQTRIFVLWQTIEAPGKSYSYARNRALLELVKANKALNGIDFSNADLHGVDFLYSPRDAKSADIRRANLESANFRGAELTRASFSEADLWGANFSHANLYNASFSNAVLGSANFSYSTLKNVELSRATLYGANFVKADLSGAVLSSSNLEDTIFSGANLTGADFKDAQNLTTKQIKTAQNWDKAIYDEAFCKKLELKQCRTK